MSTVCPRISSSPGLPFEPRNVIDNISDESVVPESFWYLLLNHSYFPTLFQFSNFGMVGF
jgi:hypothetical protein